MKLSTIWKRRSPPAASSPASHNEMGLKNLWRFMRSSLPYWRWLGLGFAAGLGRMILPLYMPIFVGNVVDRVLLAEGLTGPQRLSILWGMIPLFAGIIVLHAVASIGRFYCPQVAASNAIRDIRFMMFRHIQRLSLAFHNKRPSGTIVARIISDVSAAQDSFDVVLIQTSQCLLEAIVITAYFVTSDWLWAVVALATVPLFIVTTRTLSSPMRAASRRQRESIERLSGRLQERMAMIREVQSFTAEDHEEDHVLNEAEILRQHTLRQQMLSGLLIGASEITRTLGAVIMIIFGVYRVLSGEATVGNLTTFYLYQGLLLGPIQSLSNLYGRMHVAAAAADRVFEFLDSEPDIRDLPGVPAISVRRPPEVRFEDVSFSYPSDDPVVVLQNVSFVAKPGMRIALVGGSGAGKSTLISLLPRFYDIQCGRITIDGQDVRSVAIQSLRQAVGIVPQEPVLFTGTIRENILYGKLDATEGEIRAAAAAANAEPFILELPKGYDAVVGERGVGLSGGQIQRIAIARAFLKDPEVLILDEATSNLDATSESLVLEALDRLAVGRTSFMIAHRLSVARSADLIVVLRAGSIVEMGTHDELLSAGPGGEYATLWFRQMGGMQ